MQQQLQQLLLVLLAVVVTTCLAFRVPSSSTSVRFPLPGSRHGSSSSSSSSSSSQGLIVGGGSGMGRRPPLPPSALTFPCLFAGGGDGNNNEDEEAMEEDNNGSLTDKVKGFFADPENRKDTTLFAASFMISLGIRAFIVEPRYIPSLSMYPTFLVGDQLAVEKVSRNYRDYQRGDVVVFNPTQGYQEYVRRDPYVDQSRINEALIKRIIAKGGDVVEVKDGKLFVNGAAQQEENYIAEGPEYVWGPRQVPDGMYMVLGDNRNHSLDSHIWGFLPKENIIGRAVLKYWPVWRLGLIEGPQQASM